MKPETRCSKYCLARPKFSGRYLQVNTVAVAFYLFLGLSGSWGDELTLNCSCSVFITSVRSNFFLVSQHPLLCQCELLSPVIKQRQPQFSWCVARQKKTCGKPYGKNECWEQTLVPGNTPVIATLPSMSSH